MSNTNDISNTTNRKRVHFDTRNRQIFFLDDKSQIMFGEGITKLKDHIEWHNDSFLVYEDTPKTDPTQEPKKMPVSQTVLCAYCKYNMNPKTKEIEPLSSKLETEKPKYIKTLVNPYWDPDGLFHAGIALYEIQLHCSQGHHFSKFFKEYVTQRAYDFLTYKEEMENGLLDPLFPDE